MKTVVIPPIIDYGFLFQLPQQMARQFARNGYEVHYCNVSQVRKEVEEVEPNLFVYHNINDLNQRINDGLKIDIFYNTWSRNALYVTTMKPKFVIYHSCDIFTEWAKYEPIMIKHSDVVLCTSQYIYDIRKREHSNVHLVRNGCNSEFIDMPYTVPDDMKSLASPISIFSGAIGLWVHSYLLKKVSEKFTTILVGREYGKNIPDTMINLGAKKHSDLVNYYNASQVGLLPFNPLSEITNAACPIKLYEYLSCGLPVVATSWDETTLEEFEGVVFATNNKEKYVDLVEEMLNLTVAEREVISNKARQIARNHTWDKKFKEIEKLIK